MDRDYEGAAWADNHEQLSNGISSLFRKLADTFKLLNEIEYDAPWRHMRP